MQILIAEDDNLQARIIRDILIQVWPDATFTDANCAGDAIQAIREEALDLVVSDLFLTGLPDLHHSESPPIGSGYDVALAASMQRPPLPCIVATADTSTIQVPGAQVLYKTHPDFPRALVGLVRSLLEPTDPAPAVSPPGGSHRGRIVGALVAVVTFLAALIPHHHR